ncbi:MAG TPA: hypothetical protein VHC44_14265 [Verrucomicrobiae bacterium]|nr:hypothetical protein [Verrucomicrobiae bacterium]
MKKLLIIFWFIAPALILAQPYKIKVGSSPNNEDGDSPRAVYTLLNSNTDWFLNNGGGGVGSNGLTAASLTSGTNFYVATSSGGFGFLNGSIIQTFAHISGGDRWYTLDMTPQTAAAGSTTSSVVVHAPISATLFTGDGSGLTHVSASIPDPLTIGTVNATTSSLGNASGNGAGITNVPLTSLTFVPVTTPFTNVITAFLRFTNAGTVYTWGVGTNLP